MLWQRLWGLPLLQQCNTLKNGKNPCPHYRGACGVCGMFFLVFVSKNTPLLFKCPCMSAKGRLERPLPGTLVQLVPMTLSSFLWLLACYVTWLCPLLLPHLPLFMPFISAPRTFHLLFSLSRMFFLFQEVTLVFSHLLREATIAKIQGASPITPYPLTFFLILLQPPPRVTLCVPCCACHEGGAALASDTACSTRAHVCAMYAWASPVSSAHSWLLVVEL